MQMAKLISGARSAYVSLFSLLSLKRLTSQQQICQVNMFFTAPTRRRTVTFTTLTHCPQGKELLASRTYNVEWSPGPVWSLQEIQKTLIPTWNQTTIPQLSILQHIQCNKLSHLSFAVNFNSQIIYTMTMAHVKWQRTCLQNIIRST